MENSSFLEEKGCKLYKEACKNMKLNYAVRTSIITEVLLKWYEKNKTASFEMPLQHKSKVCEMRYNGCKRELRRSHSHRCPTLSCDESLDFFPHRC